MSYDVFVQGFENGDARDSDAAAIEAVLAPYVVEREPGFARLRVGDDDSELYGYDDLRSGFTVSRTGPAVFDVVFEAAKAGDLTIILPGCPTAIVHEGQRAHLPPELTEYGVALVTSGEDVRRLLTTC